MHTKLKLVAVALACVSMAACATTANVQVKEAQGTAAAWASLNAVASTLDGLAKSHVLHGAKALEVAADLQKATDALTAADNARKAGDNASADQNVATATALITSLIAIAANPGS